MIQKKPNILKLVSYQHAILRKVIKPIEFPLSRGDRELIEDMKYSIQGPQLKKANAPWDGAAGMAANQWGKNRRIFLFCPEADTGKKLKVVINPSYEPIDSAEDEAWESCFSVPLATGKVRRHQRIKITYQNEQGDLIEEELTGWPARVWQHETDHLNGLLYDDTRHGRCSDKRTFLNKEEVEDFYRTMK